MPTYVYRCSSCGHTDEHFQRITATPLKECPSCGKSTYLRVIMGGGGFLFKGSGFYITDHRSESYKKAVKAERENSKPSAEKKEKKTEKAKVKTD
jgi:putative FmdB family regulatory protein